MKSPQTYKDVGRMVSRLRESGASRAEIATKRAKWWAEVTKKKRKKERLKRSIHVPGRERLDAIRDDICKAYDIEPSEIYSRARSHKKGAEAIGAARKSFVIAGRDAGYSSPELAMYLRRPGAHSSVLYMRDNATLDERAVANAALIMDEIRRSEERVMQLEEEAQLVRDRMARFARKESA